MLRNVWFGVHRHCLLSCPPHTISGCCSHGNESAQNLWSLLSKSVDRNLFFALIILFLQLHHHNTTTTWLPSLPWPQDHHHNLYHHHIIKILLYSYYQFYNLYHLCYSCMECRGLNPYSISSCLYQYLSSLCFVSYFLFSIILPSWYLKGTSDLDI